MMGPWGGGWWAVMTLLWLAFLALIALIVFGAVLIARSFWERGRGGHRTESNRALDILDERFARGEIDHQEYEERRRALASRS
jgi:putative membrane protein